MYQKRAAILGLVIMASVGSPKASAADSDDLIARHMIPAHDRRGNAGCPVRRSC
jgi:hypothetical protein